MNLFTSAAIPNGNVKEHGSNVRQRREKYSPNGKQDQWYTQKTHSNTRMSKEGNSKKDVFLLSWFVLPQIHLKSFCEPSWEEIYILKNILLNALRWKWFCFVVIKWGNKRLLSRQKAIQRLSSVLGIIQFWLLICESIPPECFFLGAKIKDIHKFILADVFLYFTGDQ